MRFLLGLGEAGNFPGAIKTVAEWFPKRERALATGIFNSGTNIGALVTPLIVPWITLTYGWYWAFVATGAVGFLWLIAWWMLYRQPDDHPMRRCGGAGLHPQPIRSNRRCASRGSTCIKYRQTWAFALGKFLTDPVWWLYLFWIPDFLNRNHGLTLTRMGPPLVAIYLIADVGSIGGGWLSSWFIGRGWTTNRARKMAMLVCALAVTPIVFASTVTSLWVRGRCSSASRRRPTKAGPRTCSR